MSTPVEGGRGVGLRVLGFPVHIDLSFVLVMGIIGWLSGANTPRNVVIWLIVAAVAVLLHELGHALVARTTGARPAIALTGFGGVTMYSPPAPLSRGRSLAIAVAGPFAGLAMGGVLWAISATVGAELEGGSIAERALVYGLFTTIAWSVLNLLPVLPLDGGQAMRELLPGDPEVRARRAALVSLVLLCPLFGLALWANQLFIALFLLVFGASNLQAVMAGSRSRRRPRTVPGGGPGAGLGRTAMSPEQVVVGLLWQGATAQARQTLEALPEGTPVDLAVHGAVLATTDQPQQGLALLRQELARRPGDGNVVALLVLTHTLQHDWDAVVADLQADYAALVPLGVVDRAMQEATAVGRPDVAGRLGAMPRPPGPGSP